MVLLANERKDVMSNEKTQPLSEAHLQKLLEALPTPIFISQDGDQMYSWKLAPYASGTARTFLDALQ